MKIYLGSDHAGFELKSELMTYLTKEGYDVEDIGAKSLDPDDDYPEFAYLAVTKVLGDDGHDPRAILVCGSGQGMAMAANRFSGIRASVVWDEREAKETRADNDSNILCLPARILRADQANDIVASWLKAEFSGAQRHKRRIAELDTF